jgi:serine phosphatase RsbU (regulator of sigma subunit)
MIKIPKKNRSYVYAAAIVLLSSVFLQFFSVTALNESVEVAVTRPLAFFLRSKILREDLDPRIKIFSLDDRSVAGLGALDLDLPTWASLINAVGERKPNSIFVDKIFDKVYPAEEVEEFIEKANSWQSPVYPIVFVYPGKIPFRDIIPSVKETANLSTLKAENFPGLTKSNFSLYGARSDILNAFQSAGHTVYNGDGKGVLFYQTDTGALVPHLGLLGAETFKIQNGIQVNGRFVPLNRNLEFVVNFLPKDRFLKRSFSLLEVVTATKKQKAITPVKEGDYVVILPAMFTGNTDWRETPFGSMPGGYYGISVLNSVLTGNWITNVKDPGFAVLLSSIVMVVLGSKISTTKLIVVTSSLVLGILLGALFLFLFTNTLIFWLPVSIAMILNLIILVVGLNQDASLEKVRLDAELATAKIVHHTFFPPVQFESSHLMLSSFYESSTECGGDWWMHNAVSPDVEYVLIGDAVGHGVPAALVASVAFAVNSTMERLKDRDRLTMPGPKEFLDILGGVLESMKSRNAVMTFQVAKFDFIACTMELANAGHTFPILIPEKAEDDRLKAGKKSLTIRLAGDPLGLNLPRALKEKKVELRPGDRIVFYSDGIIENKGGKDQSAMKMAGLSAIIEASAHQNVEIMKKDILKSYLTHVGDQLKDDDATLVVVSYQPHQNRLNPALES